MPGHAPVGKKNLTIPLRSGNTSRYAPYLQSHDMEPYLGGFGVLSGLNALLSYFLVPDDAPAALRAACRLFLSLAVPLTLLGIAGIWVMPARAFIATGVSAGVALAGWLASLATGHLYDARLRAYDARLESLEADRRHLMLGLADAGRRLAAGDHSPLA